MTNTTQSTYDQIKALVREHLADEGRPCRLLAIAAALLRQVESGDPSDVREVHDMARRLEEMSGSSDGKVDVTLS